MCSPFSSCISSPSGSKETVRSRQIPLSYGVLSVHPMLYCPTSRTVRCLSVRGLLHESHEISRILHNSAHSEHVRQEERYISADVFIVGRSFWRGMKEEDVLDEGAAQSTRLESTAAGEMLRGNARVSNLTGFGRTHRCKLGCASPILPRRPCGEALR